MSRWTIKDVVASLIGAAFVLATTAGSARAESNEKLLIPVGHAEVVSSDLPVKTVAIGEPKVADAAVGSERTVVVNGKTVGSTSLVVYGEGGRFRVYDVEVFTPNGDKQVALHVRVAEVNDRAMKDLGFDFYGAGVKNGVPMQGGILTAKNGGGAHSDADGHIDGLTVGPNTDGFFAFTNKFGDLEMQTTWRALEEKGDIRILANPTLVARSGEEAKFLAGGEFPIPIASTSGSNSIAITIEWKEFGVKVDFTPTVDADGGITLKVAPEVSDLDFTNPLQLNGFVVPLISTRKTSTTVHLNAGEHLVIGGLKQTTHTKVVKKVPVLGDIPLLNLFFSATHNEDIDRDLLVVVSPEMLAGGSSKLPALPTDRPLKK